MAYTDLELSIGATPDGYTADLRLELPSRRSDLATAVPLALDPAALAGLLGIAEAYSAALTAMLFTPPLREAWQRAMGFHERAGDTLRLRLSLAAADYLHSIRWELLRDPLTNHPLAHNQHVCFSRFLSTTSLREARPPAAPDLRALLVVADVDAPHLPPIDVAAEVERASTALAGMDLTTLTGAQATLPALITALSRETHMLHLVCHGELFAGVPLLYLAGDPPTSGHDFVNALAQLAQRPLLVTLAVCESGGNEEAVLTAVGPYLARAGIPAVLGMHGKVPQTLLAELLPTFYAQCRQHGQIDRALAAARATLGGDQPWWLPVLWMALRDGRLWQAAAAEPTPPVGPETRLRALFHDHTSFMQDRLATFVGRQQELATIRQQIAALLPEGGYVTISGPAGQGKSSIIARLVADDYGADGQPLTAAIAAAGAEQVACHFIPFAPGPDHQVGLLRNLLARLCLRYGLPEFYCASDSRPALRDYFARALQDIAEQGAQLIIYIDGLDQIEEDLDGRRDLSFLPLHPPAGVVFVLGTRPDDTLAPLELKTSCHQYRLPEMSRQDFTLLLAQRGVNLDTALTERFYTAMQQNALYLDLVARELQAADAFTPEQIVEQVADNPANLFALAVERLRRQRQLWRELLKPLLGFLLATRAPLSVRALRTLTGCADEDARLALQRLGGLLSHDGDGRYSLYHLKLAEFLRQDPSNAAAAYVFATDEEEQYHQRLADWCAGGDGGIAAIWRAGGDALEQERRAYARQHCIAHLAAARSYERLWQLLDAGAYGRAKIQADPSTRAYALDLDIARQAVIAAAANDVIAQVRMLPRLWQYSLLRCSLASRVDAYPSQMFAAQVLLGHSQEAINQAELVTDPAKKAYVFCLIAQTMINCGDPDADKTLQRALHLTSSIASDIWMHDRGLQLLAAALIHGGQWQTARQLIDRMLGENNNLLALRNLAMALAQSGAWEEARHTAEAIPAAQQRNRMLLELAEMCLQAGQPDAATALFAATDRAVNAITEEDSAYEARRKLIDRMLRAQQWQLVRQSIAAVPATNVQARVELHCDLAMALAQAGRHSEAADTISTARQLATVISNEEQRSAALRQLAQALAAAGRLAEANSTCAAARQAADKISDAAQRDAALQALAGTLARIGQWEQARQTLTTMTQHQDYAVRIVIEALVESGQYNLACQTAESVVDAPADALQTLVEALAERDQWELAQQHLQRLTEGWRQAQILPQLFDSLLNAGQWQLAREAADAIGGDMERTKALGRLALVLTRAGLSDDAYATFVAAQQTAAASSDRDYQHWALSDLAELLLEAGQYGLAVEAVASIKKTDARIERHIRLAADLNRAGRSAEALESFRQAQQLIAGITSHEHRLEMLGIILVPLAEAGLADDVAQIFAEVQQIAATAGNQTQRAAACGRMAEALAQAEQLAAARAAFAAACTAAGTIADDHERGYVLHDLLPAYAHIGQHQPEAATFVAALWQSAEPRLHRGALMETCIRLQLWDLARQTADRGVLKTEQADALCTLGTALVAAGRTDDAAEAFAAARQRALAITAEQERVAALRSLIQALIEAGEWQLAREVAGDIPQTRQRMQVWALSQLAAALSEAGLNDRVVATFQAAQELSAAIAAPPLRSMAFSDIAAAAARAGMHAYATEAFALADQLAATDTLPRTAALAVLARAFGEAGRTSDAVAAFGEACRAAAAIAPDEEQRDDVLALLVENFVDTEWNDQPVGTGDDVRAAAESIAGARQRAEALSMLATFFARTGQPDAALASFRAALQSASAIADTWYRCEALNGLIMIHPEMPATAEIEPVFAAARQAAAAFEIEMERSGMRRKLAAALAIARQWELARQIAAAIEDEGERAEEFGALTARLARAQQWELAQRSAATISAYPLIHADACAALAGALSRARHWELARQTIDSIGEKPVRAAAIRTLIAELIAADRLPQAVVLLCEAWLQADNAAYLLDLLAVDAAIINSAPHIGPELLDSFTWVDAQIGAR